ncbi:hypothetical protein D3C78_1707330 [compost metagenome]
MNSVEYKGYTIAGDGTFGMKEIKPIGKGSVPNALRGKYTTSYRAQIAIDTYLDGKPKVE